MRRLEIEHARGIPAVRNSLHALLAAGSNNLGVVSRLKY
jgi:hypothetical protein